LDLLVLSKATAAMATAQRIPDLALAIQGSGIPRASSGKLFMYG